MPQSLASTPLLLNRAPLQRDVSEVSTFCFFYLEMTWFSDDPGNLVWIFRRPERYKEARHRR